MKLKVLLGALMVLCLLVYLTDARSDENGHTFKLYSLPKAQGEVLALLLRLEPPQDTTIKTDSDTMPSTCTIAVSAPQKVQDAIAPLVELLNAEHAALYKARKAKEKKKFLEDQEVIKQLR